MGARHTINSPSGAVAEVCAHSGELRAVLSPSGAPLTTGSAPVVRIGLRDLATSELEVVSSGDDGVEVEVTTETEQVTVSHGWRDRGLTARARLRAVPEGFAWTAEVTADASATIEWLEVGSVVVPDDLSGHDGPGRIVWPWAEGVLVDTLSTREQGWFARTDPSYPNGTLDSIFPGAVCSPLVAHHGADGGLVLWAQDVAGTPAMVEYGRVDDGIELVIRTYAGGAEGTFDLGHDVVLSHFDGGWQGAAERYRNWFASATTLVPLHERDDLPAWYSSSPLILTYPVRGSFDRDVMTPNKLYPFPAAVPQVERYAALAGVPVMALLMHWEGTAPWAPPYVWPPYGGEEGLQALADALHAGGNLLGLYCSGIAWTQSSRIDDYDRSEEFDAEGWAEVMCRAPDGSLPLSQVCTNQRSGYDMCPAHPRVLPTMRAELGSMLGVGVDYVQLYDQNSGGHSLFCYDTRHGHGWGPGGWQTGESLRVQRELAADAAAAGALLGTEFGASEPYLETFLMSDLRFEAGYGVGTPIPLYQYLYHPYVTNFMGNQVVTHHLLDHERSPDNLLYRLAYAFSAGELLTLPITDEGTVSWNWGSPWTSVPEQEPLQALVAGLCRWRADAAGRFLDGGRMLAPREHRIASRAIHRKQTGDLMVDQVLNTRWQAPDGARAQVLVNWTQDDAEVLLEDADAGRVTLVTDPDGAGGTLLGDGPLHVPPLTAVLLLEQPELSSLSSPGQ